MAAVPWTTLSTDVNYEYISSESLPEGVFLLDPSKLQLQQIQKIWRLWSDRQSKSDQGLIFLKALYKDLRTVDSMAGPSKDRRFTYTQPSDLGPEDDFDESEKIPHLDSPAAHAMSKTSKMLYLRTLSQDLIYKRFVDLLHSKDELEVSVVLFLSKLQMTTSFSGKMAPLPRIFRRGATGNGTRSSFLRNFTATRPFRRCDNWPARAGWTWVPMRNLLSCPWDLHCVTCLQSSLSKKKISRRIFLTGSSLLHLASWMRRRS